MSIITAWLASHALAIGVGTGGPLALSLVARWLPGFLKGLVIKEFELLLEHCLTKPHLVKWLVMTAQVIETEIPDTVDFRAKVDKLTAKYPKLKPLAPSLVKLLTLANEAVNMALKEEIKKNTP